MFAFGNELKTRAFIKESVKFLDVYARRKNGVNMQQLKANELNNETDKTSALVGKALSGMSDKSDWSGRQRSPILAFMPGALTRYFELFHTIHMGWHLFPPARVLRCVGPFTHRRGEYSGERHAGRKEA